MRWQRLSLVFAACVVLTAFFAGCAVFKTILANQDYAIIRAEPSSSLDEFIAAATTRGMIDVVDKVARARGWHRITLPADPTLEHPGDYLRYEKRGDEVLNRWRAIIIIRLKDRPAVPAIYVQGSTSASGEIVRTAKEIDRALRLHILYTKFKLEIHHEFSFN